MREILVLEVNGQKAVPIGEVHKLIQSHAERIKTLEAALKLEYGAGYDAAIDKLRSQAAMEYRALQGEGRALKATEWADWLQNNRGTSK
jgi:hypothetical protein